ncbi:MAG TPA: hypothetical protein VMC09_02965 [Anaerolineales bacterium]|nr:hypothetical protein [Anaerolineales bacterium]
MRRLLPILTLLFVLSACEKPAWGQSPSMGTTPTSPSPATATSAASPTSELQAMGLPTDTPSIDQPPAPTPAPDAWKTLPIVPTVSPAMVQLYQRGLAAGRDPNKFSKIGDCQNITTYYLADFDNPADYRLGSSYAYLQPTIDHFAGSWSRESLAVKGGMGVAAVIDPYSIFKDQKQCGKDESPLACEIRVNNPSIVIISMETWYAHKPVTDYDKYLRQVVQYVLSQNIVPILATKADNLEGDYSINADIARIAYDYQVPLWNFWAATYPLPSHGLTADEFHLTQARDFFDDPVRMESAWPWRNLTALQAIDAVYRGVSGSH